MDKQISCHGVPPLHLTVWNPSSKGTAQNCCANAMEVKQSCVLLEDTMWCYGQQHVIWLFVCYAHEGKVSCNQKKNNFVHVMHWRWTFCIVLLSIQATCCKGECLGTMSCVQLPGPIVKAMGQILFASLSPSHSHPWNHIACKWSQLWAGTLGCVGPQMPKCLGG